MLELGSTWKHCQHLSEREKERGLKDLCMLMECHANINTSLRYGELVSSKDVDKHDDAVLLVEEEIIRIIGIINALQPLKTCL